MMFCSTNHMTKSINDTMNHDPPMNKFVIPVEIPEGIWALYVVFMLPFYLVVLENLANVVNSAKGLEDAMILHTMTMCSQVTHYIAQTRLCMSGLKLGHKLIKLSVTQC